MHKHTFCQKIDLFLVHQTSKRNANSTQCSQAVTHPSTDRTRHSLTSEIGRDLVLSVWYGRMHLSWAC